MNKLYNPTEKEIKIACQDYLIYLEKSSKVYSYKTQVAKIQIKVKRGQKPRWLHTGKEGNPDHTLCLSIKIGGEKIGVFCGFEWKRIGGRQSIEQKHAQDFIRYIGGYYFIIKSIDDIDDAIKSVMFDMVAKIKRIKGEL